VGVVGRGVKDMRTGESFSGTWRVSLERIVFRPT
jgi:hypothetical protein